MIKVYFAILCFFTFPLFAIEFTPLTDLQTLSIDKQHDELTRRLILANWDGKPEPEIMRIFERFRQASIDVGFSRGEILALLRNIHKLDYFNVDDREKAKKNLSMLKKRVNRIGDHFLSIYFTYISGYLLYFENEDKLAIEKFAEALSKSRGIEKLMIYYQLSDSHMYIGDKVGALKIALKYNELAKEYGIKYHIVESYELLGRIYFNLSDFAKSADSAFKALELYKKMKNYSSQVSILNLISTIKHNLKKQDERLKYLLEAERLFNQDGIHHSRKSLIYRNISSIYADNKQFEKAEQYINKALEISKQNNHFSGIVTSQLYYANLLLKTNHVTKALILLNEANGIEAKHWNNQQQSWYFMFLAKAHAELEEYQKAKVNLAKAITLSEKYDRVNLEMVYEFAINFYDKIASFKGANGTRKKLLDLIKKKQEEQMKKLLYNKENQNLVAKNRQNELVLESQRTRLLMLVGFILAFLIILALQFNRNRIIKAKNLELKRKEALVREKTADLEVILDNIHQGVVTIDLVDDSTHLIKNTSLYFFEIFQHLDKNHLLEKGTLQSLFVGSSLNSEDLSKISSIVLSSTHESLWQWELNESSLPKEMTLIELEKIIEIDWAVALESDLINKVIITFKDVTELRKLGDKQKQNEISTQKLVALALMDQREYFILINSIQKLIEESINVIDSHEEFLREALDLAFRNLHTIKGLARTFDMVLLSSFTHDIENVFQKTRDKTLAYDRKFLLKQLDLLMNEIDTYRQLAKLKLRWDNEVSSVSLPVGELTNWYQRIAKLSGEFQVSEDFKPLLQDIKRRYSSTLNDALNNILISSQKLSKEMGKGEIHFELIGCDIFIDQSYQDKLSSIFVHLIRNSIDHGFVPVEQRQQFGLLPPQIQLTLTKRKLDYQITYQDNGRGLNLQALKKKAYENKLAFAGEDSLAIAQLIFISGFSTKHEVSNISGRGVGMDAVRDFLVKSGGDIRLIALTDVIDGFLPVSFELTLPTVFFDD